MLFENDHLTDLSGRIWACYYGRKEEMEDTDYLKIMPNSRNSDAAYNSQSTYEIGGYR